MPDIKITDCDYTIAFWIKLFRGPFNDEDTMIYHQPIIIGSLISGKTLQLSIFVMRDGQGLRYWSIVISRQVTMNTTLLNTIDNLGDMSNKWTHIAVTCEQDNKFKTFIDGGVRDPFKGPGPQTLQKSRSGKPPQNTYLIGKGLTNYFLPFEKQLYGSVMDLHIAGFVLPPDQIFDLHRGQKFVIFYFLLCL